jgi:DNA-binding NarL/FixJ family response regulator
VTAARLRVLIADDQALVRAGFRLILEAQPDIEVSGEAADGETAVRLARRHHPDVVLMDIRMPGLDGLEATRRLLSATSDGTRPPRVVILTTFDLDEYVYAALQAGASGFLLKDVSPEHLVGAVRTVAIGDALLAPSITRRLVERFARPPAVIDAAPDALGRLTARETAATLVVTEATIKTHVAGILSKLELRNRAQAVVLAYESGIVQAGGGVPSGSS